MDRSSAAAVGTAAPAGSAGVSGSDDPWRASRAPAQAATAGAASALSGAAQAWAALGGDGALLDRVSCTPRALLPSRLPVLELARASVAVCSLAAAELASVRADASRFAGAAAGPTGSATGGATGDSTGSGPGGASNAGVRREAGGSAEGVAGHGAGQAAVPSVHVDDGAVATAFTAERHLRTDGRAPETFAPLSRFWRTRDGWLRTHANYHHHRARLLDALGIPVDESDDAALAEVLAAELAGRDAIEVEETVQAAGGLAVAVRTPEEWAAHPQGVQSARRPLLTTACLDQALPRALPEPAGRGPLHAVRVLDLTRVLAGPVATRALALFGADVLRIDAPQLPEHTHAHAATGAGKRSAFLDLSSRSGQAAFEELLSAADVVVTGYRPGALDRFGCAPESLADRHPGVIVAQISAWGAYGPWHRRRGFDSLVQAATGISLTEGQPDESGEETPGALPAQALDHGTGYLLAAAVMRALTEQRQGRCGARLLRLALAQTANWLMYGLTSQTPPGARHEVSAPPAPGPAAPATRPTTPAAPDTPAGTSASDPAPSGPAAAPHGGPEPVDPAYPAAWLAEADSPLGRLRYALPPVGYDGSPADWPAPPGVPGSDPAAWW